MRSVKDVKGQREYDLLNKDSKQNLSDLPELSSEQLDLFATLDDSERTRVNIGRISKMTDAQTKVFCSLTSEERSSLELNFMNNFFPKISFEKANLFSSLPRIERTRASVNEISKMSESQAFIARRLNDSERTLRKAKRVSRSFSENQQKAFSSLPDNERTVAKSTELPFLDDKQVQVFASLRDDQRNLGNISNVTQLPTPIEKNRVLLFSSLPEEERTIETMRQIQDMDLTKVVQLSSLNNND